MYTLVVYGGSKLTNSFVRLGPAEQGIDASGASVSELATIAPVRQICWTGLTGLAELGCTDCGGGVCPAK